MKTIMPGKKTARSTTKKKRKAPNGPIRNKDWTKQKIIKAVGTILAKEGYTGLNIVKVARVANVDRKLIYKYFGSLDKLIGNYFKENGFWKPSYNKYISHLLTRQQPLTQQNIMTVLEGQLESMMTNGIFQKTVHWEISEKNKLMRKVSDEREQTGEALFMLVDKKIKTNVDLRAILALQVAGIYYLALHAKMNGSTFCGIDINLPEGRKRIENALKQILKGTYG